MMEEVIAEIVKAEETAEKIIAEAEEQAKLIEEKALVDVGEIRQKYENKLNEDSAALMDEAKSAVKKMISENNASAKEKADELRRKTQDKIAPCASFVYDFIIKEFTE